ncbi:amino acid ABC transporter permease [uncultured Treponema sp.]|uniref:amino acid ABC transporter permease n=1 Tax=uncultured Treponema sp. TaxID=162155 RepID=UPI0015BAFD04|nr:amino acid ABC transporter permease [uncultured Treponema sp.]
MNILKNLDFAKAVRDLLPQLLGKALGMVVTATIAGFILGLAVGFILALARISKNKALNRTVVLFQELIRGTPLLVQLVYIYYVVPLLITCAAQLIGIQGFRCNLTPLVAGIIGLGVNYGTYIAEVIRAAIISIDGGQKEAALALGLTPSQAMMRIVVPQAMKNSIPVFGNYLVMMVKDTSLMSYITAAEFLTTAKAYTSQTFLTIESYTILAAVYLVICIPLGILAKWIEQKSNAGKR